MKLFFDSCPRCRGTVRLERDVYGVDLSCINCGYSPTVTPPERLPRPAVMTKPRTPRRPWRVWTGAEEIKAIEMARKGRTPEEIGDALGRTATAVENRLSGLRRAAS
jgi:hypothetical protein